MREYGSNIILPSLDNLFSSEQERQDAKLEKIQILPLSELHPFEGHPFHTGRISVSSVPCILYLLPGYWGLY